MLLWRLSVIYRGEIHMPALQRLNLYCFLLAALWVIVPVGASPGAIQEALASSDQKLCYDLKGTSNQLVFGKQAAVNSEGLAADESQGADLAQESSNPVGSLTMFNIKTSLALVDSREGPYSDRTDTSLIINVQPVIPITLSEDWRLLMRPVIPLISQPYRTFATAGSRRHKTLVDTGTDYTFGLGDIVFAAMFSPVSKEAEGFIGGLGPTFMFPTATDKILGRGKWSIGSAGFLGYSGKGWIAGIFPQHWWSVGGDPDRNDVSLTQAQYFAMLGLGNGWQIGMAPTITIDWLQKDPDNRWTVPVGLMLAKIVHVGKVPVKIAASAEYSVFRPRTIPSAEWNFWLQLTPILSF